MVDLQKLLPVGHVAALGGQAFTDAQPAGGDAEVAQGLIHLVSGGIGSARGDEGGGAAEFLHVGSQHGRAAGIGRLVTGADAEDRCFVGALGRFAEAVAVTQGVADDQHPPAAHAAQGVGDDPGGEAPPSTRRAEPVADVQPCAGAGLGTLQVLQQCGAAEGHPAARKQHASAAGFDPRPLAGQARVVAVFVLAAFDVEVGPQGVDHRLGGGAVGDDHVVDKLQGREVFGPVLLGDVGAGAVGLLDGVVAGEADHQDIAVLAGGLQIAHVAGVDDVEAAVTEHHPACGGPVAVGQAGQGVQGHDLAVVLDLHIEGGAGAVSGVL